MKEMYIISREGKPITLDWDTSCIAKTEEE